VPPPTSRFRAAHSCSALQAAAPLPLPAMTDSRSGPAVETTNFPAKSEICASTAAAFSLRAASPVMIAAPVATSPGLTPAARYSAATMARTAAPSICVSRSSGVK
jgi:hypothetical protein